VSTDLIILSVVWDKYTNITTTMNVTTGD